MCECFHCSLKAMLAHCFLQWYNWVDQLPWVMLGLRLAPKENLEALPAELVLGGALRVPGEFLPESVAPLSLPMGRASFSLRCVFHGPLCLWSWRLLILA